MCLRDKFFEMFTLVSTALLSSIVFGSSLTENGHSDGSSTQFRFAKDIDECLFLDSGGLIRSDKKIR